MFGSQAHCVFRYYSAVLKKLTKLKVKTNNVTIIHIFIPYTLHLANLKTDRDKTVGGVALTKYTLFVYEMPKHG